MSWEDLRWFELFNRRATRRELLRVGASAAALVSLGGTLPARRGDSSPRFREYPFTLGVASGDPLPDGVVLWTRLSGETVAEAGALPSGVPVRWEVAEDEAFEHVVRNGATLAVPDLGYSVHAEVEGLQPGRVYYYRFLAGGYASVPGRARTAPAPGSSNQSLRFVFCSCQNWEDGYYTAYRHMSNEDVDLIVHLGDYIYEGGISRNAVRANNGPEVYDLDQYRGRFALYRGDADLQAAHAAASWVVTWDDHDLDNNYAAGIPQDQQELQGFLMRRAAAYQAYYEFMPLRRTSMPAGPDMRIYRRLVFGDLAAMSVLDTRQYRDDQACGDRYKPDCEGRLDPSRTLLGREQESWLLNGLREPGPRWNLIAQQVLMSPLMQINNDGVRTHSMDTWDGYPGARQRLLEAFASGQVASPVVLTGDVHSSWVADLHVGDQLSPLVGTELVGTSITTNGDGLDVGNGPDILRDWNPHLRFHDERRGYVRCDVTREHLTAYFRAIPYISRPGAPLETRATFVVEQGRPGAQRAG
jgi:alkaline phosphatase D